MEDTIIFIGLIPALLLGGFFALWILKEGYLYGLYDHIYVTFGISVGKYFTFGVYTLDTTEQATIFDQIKYYRQLSDFDKKQFNHRVKKFIKKKEFIGREGLEVTREMELIIAAKAIMLSFGFGKYELYDFSKILVYPSDYYSRITGNYHKGEVNPRGIIVLSWQHIEEGISDATDNLNLGIHEFAHAYLNEAESIDDNNEGYGEPSMIHNRDALYRLFRNDRVNNELREASIFREYAFTNHYEFFAVACEHFFETPRKLKQSSPEVYHVISKMLNQDTSKMGL